jgi:molybdopterin converting factor subunit 1
MTVCVHLFARARELAETDTLRIDLPETATVADVRQRLAAVCPALAGFISRCAIAVGEDFAADAAPVSPRAVVAVIPPVSGG